MDQLVIDVPAREHPQDAGRRVLVQADAGTARLEQRFNPLTLHVTSDYRIDSPLFTHVLFGVYIATIMWAGLVLRYPALQTALFSPLQRRN